MPMYTWKCSNCGAEEAVIRPVSQIDEPPEPADSAPEGCPHAWSRIMSGKQAVVKGPSWGGSKGNW